jgi:hypothetical protein
MSQENLEALKAVYEVGRWRLLDAGDFDPDVEAVWAGEMPDLAGLRGQGLSAVETAMRTWLSAWEEYRWEADRFMPVREYTWRY